MNKVYAIVKIIEMKYNFLPKDKKNAVCKIKAILNNNSEIELLAYNKTADKCYKKLEINKEILIEGFLNSEMKIVILKFENVNIWGLK